MSGRALLSCVAAVLVLPGAGVRGSAAVEKLTPCPAARVSYGPYPGKDDRLSRIPWIRGDHSLVGLLWPEEWTKARVRRVRIPTGGETPWGSSTKILWVWVGSAARSRGGGEVVVTGRRLGGRERFRQTFVAVSYAGQRGAPSFASIVDVPRPGCWQLALSTGKLRAHVIMRAVDL